MPGPFALHLHVCRILGIHVNRMMHARADDIILHGFVYWSCGDRKGHGNEQQSKTKQMTANAEDFRPQTRPRFTHSSPHPGRSLSDLSCVPHTPSHHSPSALALYPLPLSDSSIRSLHPPPLSDPSRRSSSPPPSRSDPCKHNTRHPRIK